MDLRKKIFYSTYRILILSHDLTITARRNELFTNKIMEAGINLSLYCKKKGLCGSGLIDLISVFLSLGDITPEGKITNSSKKIQIDDFRYLTQKDIRECQAGGGSSEKRY